MEQPLYLFPDSLEKAVELYCDPSNDFKLLGGGTAVSRLFKKTGKFPEGIIDLKRCSLDKISKNGKELHIGACSTIGSLVDSPVVSKFMKGIFMELLPHLASTQLRNLITAAGNIIQVFPWSDLPVLALLLDAEIFYIGKGGPGSIAYTELVKSNPSRVFGKENIVTHIVFTEPESNVQASAVKFSRTGFDYSITTGAVRFGVRDNRIFDPVIVVGGSVPLPIRAQEAEQFLNESVPDEETFTKAAELAVADIRFSRVNNISPEYRSDLTAALLKKCFNNVKMKISGSGEVQ